MNLHKFIFVLILALTLSTISTFDVYSGHRVISETDNGAMQLFSVFDLRERETYVQITNTGSSNITIHVQIHNVDQDCNENNFYDLLTPNDTHIYNLRNVESNDGNPTGVLLPDNAYGRVTITYVEGVGLESVANDPANRVLIGNFMINDNNGYQYRTNSAGFSGVDGACSENTPNGQVGDDWFFNFNMDSGVTFSDIFILTQDNDGGGDVEVVVDPVDDYELFDVDIFDLNENVFSCRNVVFACIDQDNPRLEELLENASGDDGSASVASFEYGINEVIPNSKNAPLLCPGNTIEEGIVKLNQLRDSTNGTYGFIGLNNGDQRGSMVAFWSDSCATPFVFE